MRRWILLVGLAGCNGGGDSDTNAACTETIAVSETWPSDGATSAYLRDTIEAVVDGDPGTATLRVTPLAGGAEIQGTTEVIGNRLRFRPASALAPSTDYLVVVERGCTGVQFNFRTSDVGSPLQSTTLDGNVYALSLDGARILEPAGAAAILGLYLDTSILAKVESTAGSELRLHGAVALEDVDPPTQAPCSPTMDFPVADFTGTPFFEVGPTSLSLPVGAANVAITDLYVTGTFSPDGTQVVGATFRATGDTRNMGAILDSDDPNAVCNLVGSLPEPIVCEPCADGQPYCLTIVADRINGVLLPNATVTPIEDECVLAECANDEDCI